jgi:hypothetical protein
MERFVVLNDGSIFNLTTSKKLEVVIKTNDKIVDIDKMTSTMSRSFSVMTRKEFIENWMLTLSLMLKNEKTEEDEDLAAEDEEFFNNEDGDMELSQTSVAGSDITNYVTAFVLGRMFGKFEKNTNVSIEVKEFDIDEGDMSTIDKFMTEMSSDIGAMESMYGNGYFEFEDEYDLWEDENDLRE